MANLPNILKLKNYFRLNQGEHAIIRLKSRVWNSTLVEDYPNIGKILKAIIKR